MPSEGPRKKDLGCLSGRGPSPQNTLHMIAAWTREEGWLVAAAKTPEEIARALGITLPVVLEAIGKPTGKTSTKAFPLREGGYIIKRIAR